MMAESNDTGALLISCGNETEIALGYASPDGDMCGGISIIGDLSKVGRVQPRPATSTIGTARRRFLEQAFELETLRPELAEGQFDPFDYAVVAPYRRRARRAQARVAAELVERFETLAASIRTSFLPDADGSDGLREVHHLRRSRAVVDDAAGGRIRRSVYKRLQGPPIVVVSERAFGFDLRETIINGWEGKE